MEEKELEILKKIHSSRCLSQQLVQRSSVILKYRLHKNKNEVSRQSNCSIKLVNTWLKRWGNNILYRDKLYKTLKSNIITEREYKRELSLIFQDNARTGSPCKFTESDKNKIVALASESPEQLGLPFTHWSLELLQKELINRKIGKFKLISEEE
jgi:hypothetical protein